MPDPKRILCVDGGGVRGIIPATVLAQLEESTGTPARESFDFVAGTSTGALVAGAVAAGIPMRQLQAAYRTRSREVFRKTWVWSFLKRIALGWMYSSGRLHRIVREELGSAADQRLNDLPIDILVTAKRVVDGAAWYFVDDDPGNAGTTGGLRLADCVTASAAAPTYFKPFKMSAVPAHNATKGRPLGKMVDGGVGIALNPVYQACLEAFEYRANQAYKPAETIVISLGTGHADQYDHHPRWILGWLQWVLQELLSEPAEQQKRLVRRVWPSLAAYYRLDVNLPDPIGQDDVGSLDALEKYGRALAGEADWQAMLDGKPTRHSVS